MADQQPLAGLQLVAFRDVLDNAVQEAHAGLAQLSERLPGLSDEERKRQLLQYLQATRQRLQRLHVCAQWAHKAKAVNTCREVLKAAQDHGAAFVHTADELFRLNEELRFGRAPLFDVSSALHISQTGNYRLLPRVIEDELQQPGQRLERPGELSDAQRAQQRRDALRRMDFLLRSKLLASELPAGVRVLRVRGGQVALAAAGGQYTAKLTLVPSPREDVAVSKFRPPGEAQEGPSAPAKEEPEVTQPAADGQPSTSAAAAASAREPSPAPAEQQREGPDCWRWRLLSFELLPAAAGHDPPLLLPAQQAWMQQHVEQHMWAAADVEQLLRLGKQAWVAVPEPAGAAKEAKQQGKASVSGALPSATPAPSSSLAPSQLAASAADDKGKQPLVKEEEVEEQPGRAEQLHGPAHDLPPHATSQLAAMHSILCLTAGRLALFSLLLSDARQLEGGSWKASLKLSRAGTGSGLRLAYWQGVPCASYAELQCLREGQPYPPSSAAGGAAAAPSPAQQQVAPAIEVAVQDDGCLAVSSSTQLQHALSGEAVQLRLPLGSAGCLNADRLLLEAAAHSAALQLAAIQAALQRTGRLAPAGVHPELSLAGAPPAGAAGSSRAQDPLPVSPQLYLWCAGSLQLSLSMQLRTGRLLLLAGPALLESEQGSEAATLVAAAQQQLDGLQRDATNLPLPPGSTRCLLAARLAADALGRLSLQLSMRRRMAAAAAAAAACGLRSAALPQPLLDQYTRQAALPLAPLSANLLTLVLPSFPPPPDMQRWARQQQQRRQGAGSGAAALGGGATRCFLLLDFGEPSAASEVVAGGPAEGAAQPAVATGSQEQLPRMLLAVCGCTARGTVTRVLRLAELPTHVVAEAQAAGAAAQGGAAAASRKRRASDAAQVDAERGAGQPASAAAGSGLELGLSRVADWCRRQAGWEALRSQLGTLPMPHAEELPLGRPQQQLIRLPKAPVLAQLESWAVAKLAAADGAPPAGPAPKPAAIMQLEAEGEAREGGAAFRVDLASAYFARLPTLLQLQGVCLAAPAADAQHIVQHAGGLTLRYSLAQGHSVLTAVTDLVRVGMLHICLTRLAGCMAANPLAAGAKAARTGSNGALAGSGGANGRLQNGQAAGQAGCGGGGGSSGGSSSLVWPLPGCGSVRLVEAGVTHLVLAVLPPPLPDSLTHLDQPPPLRLTVSWDNTLLAGSTGDASAPAPAALAALQRTGSSAAAAAAGAASQAPSAAEPAAAGAAGTARAAPGAASTGGSGGSGSLRHIRCRVSSEPPLPEPVEAALAHQLELGRVDLFLDSLCLACHSAAAAARQLAPEAQRAAGLLPAAFKLHSVGAAAAAAALAESTAAHGSSALRLGATVQQGSRAASLRLAFHAGGYTLLQMAPGPSASAAAAASAWLPQLWDRLAKSVATLAPVDAAPAANAAAGGDQRAPAQQQHQAWVHHSGLAAALALVMEAIAST